MSKKTKTTQDTTSHQVQTPQNPEWVTSGIQGLAGQISGLSNADPYSFVAGADPLQTQAAQGASSLGQFGNYGGQPSGASGMATPTAEGGFLGGMGKRELNAGLPKGQGFAGIGALNRGEVPVHSAAPTGAPSSGNPYTDAMSTFNDARDATANTAQGASLLDNLQSYMSPYTNDVVNSSLADYDYGAGQAVGQNKLALAGDTTFGGSGGAIQTALSNDALTRSRGTLSAGLRDQAFQTGANLSNLDAGRRQQNSQFNAGQADIANQQRMAGAQGLVNTASTQQGDQRANIATQGTLGQMLQQLSQQRAAAPLNLLQAQTGMYGSLPLGLFNGQTTDGTQHTNSKTTTSDPLGSIGSLAMGLGALGFAPLTGGASLAGMGAMVSDRRLKRDVVKLGTRPDGLAVYAYRYLGSMARTVGVMAQEVLKVKPEAVITMDNGFYAVNYGAL